MRQGPARLDLLLQRLRSGRLWWLFLVTAMVSLTTLTGMLHEGRRQILLQAKQNVDNLAWVLESRLSSTLQRIDSDMQQMARVLVVTMLTRQGAMRERERIEALLSDHVAGFPDVMRSTVFDADGALLYSSDPATDRTLNVADRDAFRQLKATPALGTLYSEVVAARGDGRQAVVIARALVASDDHFQGIMFTLLDLDRYQRLIDSLDIGASGLVSVRRRDDNRLVLRRPQAPADINRALDTPAWRRVEGGEASGLTHMVSPIDRIPRLQSFRTLPDHPFYVTAAFAEADLLAGWWQEVVIVSSLAVALLAGFGRLIARMDRSERRRNLADEALAQSQRDLRVAARAFDSQMAMLIADERFTVIKVNQAYTRVTGFSSEEAVGQDAWFRRSVDRDETTEAAQRGALREAGYWAGEMRSRRKNGETFEAWLTISAVHADDGSVTHHVAGFTDITEHKAGEERIHALAFYDPLTQLPNRRLLDERLQHAMTVSERNRSQCALLFLDLDHFKLVNDTRGHTVGDSLLVAVAGRLRLCVRASDTVARRGGDEFVLLLEALDADAATAAARAGEVGEKIRLALAEPLLLDGEEYHGSASLGVCLFLGNQIGADELFKRCDTAMYQAKHAGRNALRFFDPAMQLELERRAALDTDLRLAIALRQFELHYQIQVDSRGRAIGAEALLRWNHPARGMVPPMDFISLAEETGAIVGIGQYVLDTACERLAAWAADPLTRELQLAINVSARQFRQADFVDTVRDSLMRSGARATQLELELTETLVMDDVVDTIAKMQALRALGVAFSVDDFGTGYSSLSYLQRLPLDKLKIDKSFVLDLSLDDSCAAIVRSIITLATVLDLEVVAEGVETEAQRAMLQEMGCNGFQGYLFARPLPLAAFLERLDATSTDAVQAVTPSDGRNASDCSEVVRRSHPSRAKPAAARPARTAVAG